MGTGYWEVGSGLARGPSSHFLVPSSRLSGLGIRDWVLGTGYWELGSGPCLAPFPIPSSHFHRALD